MSQKISALELSDRIQSLGNCREKLVLFAGDSRMLDELFEKVFSLLSGQLVELSFPLAEQLLPLSLNARSRKAIELTRGVLSSRDESVMFVRRIEILFQPSLRVNPLSLFRTLSQEKTMVIRWPGDFANGLLTYAYPQHAEFFSSKPDALPVIHEAGLATYLTFTQ